MVIIVSLTLLNAALLSAGLNLAWKVHEEETEILKYKKISELQFALLNKKIEALNGNAGRI